MKRTIIVLAVILVVAGFIRGWFAVTGPQREKASGKVDVNLAVDPGKVKEDAEKVKEKAVELKDKAAEEIKAQTHKDE